MVLGDLNRYMQRNETRSQTYTIHKNSRWIKDLNISCDTIKVLEENMGRKTSDIPCSSIYTNMSPKTRDKRKE